MDKLEEINTVFLDFDGTIHNVADTYHKILEDTCILAGISKSITKEESRKYLGYSPTDMWREFMPDLPKEQREKLMNSIGLRLESDILAKKTTLFKGTEEVFSKLKEDNKTIILISNCMNKYRDNAIKRFNLDKYVTRFYTSEEFDYIPKEKILEKVIDKYKGDYIFVGDRFHDMLSADYNNIKSIFCNYGYGKEEEGNNANYRIDDIKEILDII